jgi:hypothetical protein
MIVPRGAIGVRLQQESHEDENTSKELSWGNLFLGFSNTRATIGKNSLPPGRARRILVNLTNNEPFAQRIVSPGDIEFGWEEKGKQSWAL